MYSPTQLARMKERTDRFEEIRGKVYISQIDAHWLLEVARSMHQRQGGHADRVLISVPVAANNIAERVREVIGYDLVDSQQEHLLRAISGELHELDTNIPMEK